MLFKNTKSISRINFIFLCIFLLNLGCNLQPLYRTSHISEILCNIRVSDTKAESNHYEEIFKNEMQNSLCDQPQDSAKYLLRWNITKNKNQLIGSKDNKTVRYKIILSIQYELINMSNNKALYADKTYSSAEYNVLEDEMVSTIASEKFSEEIIAKNLTNIILDKIYLFMANNENPKL